jgi:nucleotide-binding universal stress UspA family protein
MAMSADYVAVNPDNISRRREEIMWQLNDLAQLLQKSLGSAIEVTMVWSELPLLRAIMDTVKQEEPQLIMLQNSNGPDLISTSLIAIAKASPVRVLVVPAGLVYQPVQRALIPVDFKALETLDKMRHFQQSPLWVPTELVVLNVDPQQHYQWPDEKFRATIERLKSYLQQYRYQIEFRDDKDIIGGIIDYARSTEIQLIIALPGKHSFLYSLTHKSISEGICKAAHLPVMVLK